MKDMHSAPPEKAWRIGKGPFVFSGVPPICTGELEIINNSDEKVKVRAIPVTPKKRGPAAGLFKEVHLAARIAPHERSRVPAQFFVEPGTPSGIYETFLTCGTQREPAAVHVFDHTAFKISPHRILLQGAGGDTLTQDLVITNTGNVSLTLPEVSLVWLEERNWVGRTLVYKLRDSPESEGHREYLDRVLEELRSTMIPSTRVFFDAKTPEIKPGDVVHIGLRLTLPKELKKGKTYLGFVKLPSRRLWLRIECIGAVVPKSRRRK